MVKISLSVQGFFSSLTVHLKKVFAYCREVIPCSPSPASLVICTLIDVPLFRLKDIFTLCPNAFLVADYIGIFLLHSWHGFRVCFASLSEVSMKLNEKEHKK